MGREEKILLNVKETREYLGLGETKTRELMRYEQFGCRIGNRLYANKLLLNKWLENRSRHK